MTNTLNLIERSIMHAQRVDCNLRNPAQENGTPYFRCADNSEVKPSGAQRYGCIYESGPRIQACEARRQPFCSGYQPKTQG